MTSVFRLQSRGLKRQEALFARTCIFKPVGTETTQELPCMPSYDERGTLVDVGGNPVEVDFSLVFRAILFPTADSEIHGADSGEWTADQYLAPPKTGDAIVYNGRTYRVLAVAKSPDRSHLIVLLADPESNA